MKKLLATFIIILLFLSFGTVFAMEEKNMMETNTASQIVEESQEVNNDIDEYTRKYGSKEYGMTAYILNKVRLFSIPFCFVAVVIGALYQYILGTRRLDMKHRGFGIIIASVTILVICQLLPLIFAIVVRGWR